MLEARIVKKRQHCRVDVDLRCGRGHLLALTGPSGTGKTTIIRALAGLEKPDGGRIYCNGVPWYDGSDHHWLAARKRRVGYVFQEHTLFPHLSVAGNVAFSCRDQERVRALLALLGISHLADRLPGRLSGGEKQRTALAQALASEPQVLLLDEPFSALDHPTRLRLQHELNRIKARLDIPVVLVTHDREEASFLGDAHLVLSGGKCGGQTQAAPRPAKNPFSGSATNSVPCASHRL